MKKELLTVKELAAELRMSVKSIQRGYRKEEIPVRRNKEVGSTLVQNKSLKCLRLVSRMGCSSTPIDGVATPCHPQAGGIVW